MRNFSCQALILNVQISGENSSTVTYFSPDEKFAGISYATLYGGPKSKLRSLVSPMNEGVIYLYRDESKNQTKITDFDVKKYHLSFRENLFKTWAADLSAEILIKTKCAGSPEETWKIENGLLDGMELSDEAESRRGLVRFLWRYLEILGIRPNTKFCVQCGESFQKDLQTKLADFPDRKFAPNDLSSRYYFDADENGFVCPDCARTQNQADLNASHTFSLGKDSIFYLEAVSSLEPKEVRKIKAGETSLNEIKSLEYFLIEQACGAKLKTLNSGIGIL